MLSILFLPTSPAFAGPSSSIYGGGPAADGAWPDTAAVLDRRGDVFCTGTLIAPDVVVTAAHCATGKGGSDPRFVVLASNSLAGGERIRVERYETHPRWRQTFDVAVLVLAEGAETEPRPLALDCVAEDALFDGAEVTLVGYGVTEDTFNNRRKNSVQTVVTDHDCSEMRGTDCLTEVSPGGELVAGGDGRDSCSGDSGGPMYLDDGDDIWLAGITSRAASWKGPTCGEGGIYVRPDAVADWIEVAADIELPRPECEEIVEDEVVEDEPTKKKKTKRRPRQAELGCATTPMVSGWLALLALPLLRRRRG